MGEHELIHALGPTLVGNRTFIIQLLLVLGIVVIIGWLFKIGRASCRERV